MFDPLLESSHRDDSNKRTNIGFDQEIMELASIEVYFTHIIWSSEKVLKINFNRLYLCYFFTKSYVLLLVRIVSILIQSKCLYN